MSHRQAADELGVSQQAFSKWAADQSRPKSDHLKVIARFLRVSEKRVREMWAAAAGPGRTVRTERRLEAIETELGELRRAVTRLLARLPDRGA